MNQDIVIKISRKAELKKQLMDIAKKNNLTLSQLCIALLEESLIELKEGKQYKLAIKI